MKKIAIITVHGMGDTKEDYHENLVEGLIDKIGVAAWNRDIHFESVFYQDILQNNQEKIWMRMHQYPLESNSLRRLMLFGFADAGTLEYSAHNSKVEYLATQKRIYDALDRSFEAGGNEMIPVIFVAQSLGGQVLSNYIWDSQGKKGLFETTGSGNSNHDKFCRLTSCQQLYTTGCNIPMFVAGLEDIECFAKPNPQFKWDNFFDSDDFLGWPLGPLDSSYKKAGVVDHHISSGGLITSQTWLSHTKYWEDKDFLKPFSRRIEALLGSA